MGCDNCADTGAVDWGAISLKCSRCNGTGNVTDQDAADAALGRAVRAMYDKDGCFAAIRFAGTIEIQGDHVVADTLDDAVKRAQERGT